MKKRIVLLVILILFIGIIDCCNNVFAGTKMEDLIGTSSPMKKVSTPDETVTDGSGIIGGINSIIGLLQLAGSGISIIVVTLLGMKYILASPADKADVKKSITPIIIGCVLLFGAVNIVAAVMDFSTGENGVLKAD